MTAAKRDPSAHWPLHEPCGHVHLPGGDCPPGGVWLMTATTGRDVVVVPRQNRKSSNSHVRSQRTTNRQEGPSCGSGNSPRAVPPADRETS